jgi:hypothetical protein
MTIAEPATVTSADPADSRVDDEIAITIEADAVERFEALVRRLSKQSVDKHFDAYEDIPWDDPEFAIDPGDQRWEVAVNETLKRTAWYRALSDEQRAELGLYLVASFMKIGSQFESILKRGLLEFAFGLPNGDPMFRYAYHETIEEAQHSLMFQEFVNRSRFDIAGLPLPMEVGSHIIVSLGRWFPELFFMFVLGGEDPIDHAQREGLEAGELPPVLERIIRIHVTEEARHLSFARHYLKLRAPELDPIRRTILGFGTPLILGTMAQLMMRPSPAMIERFEIPREVLREAFGTNPDHHRRTKDALRKVRRLSREIGIINPVTTLVWKGLGIWDDDESPNEPA